ncbi:MAG: hypothetical protein WEA10_04250 [Actinomycetota bacterium]
MTTYIPLISVLGTGVAFVTLVALRPSLWLRWLSTLLLSVAFGFAVMIASLPVLEQRSGLDDPFLPLSVGMIAGDIAFVLGAILVIFLSQRSPRTA